MNTEQRLLRRLRLQLSAVYTAAVVLFIGVNSALIYRTLGVYFQDVADAALRSRMAVEFMLLGQPLPDELRLTTPNWLALGRFFPREEPHEEDTDEEREERSEAHEKNLSRLPSPDNLSNVFLVWLDGQGRYRVLPTTVPEGFTPNIDAIRAVQNGQPYDQRTVTLRSGEPLRLLTYAVPDGHSKLYLQAGRSLAEQQLILQGVTIIFWLAGGVLVGFAGVLSWLLSGRAIHPVNVAWSRQRDFVANASHELRTPLALIQLSAEVAQREDTPPQERQELMDSIVREARYMNTLIENLLLLSRADAGKLPLKLQRVEVASVFEDVYRSWQSLCNERGLTLHIVPTSSIVLADPVYLRQMLMALIDNSVRHTSVGGEITLEAVTQQRRTQIIVRDTGEGIPPEHLPRVFERFYQADTAHSRKGSSGLGLPVVKVLAEAMHGEIRLSSVVGQGTTVVLWLPTAA